MSSFTATRWAPRSALGATCSLQQQRGPPQAQARGRPAAASANELSRPPPIGRAEVSNSQPQQQQEAQLLAAPAAAAAAAGVAAVAFDVFGASSGPTSLHLLQPLDAAAHAWVAAHLTDAAAQSLLLGKLVSDAGIVAGLAAWAAVTFAALQAQPAQPKLLGTVGVAWALYAATGGSIRHGDTPLVGALKEGFHRARPSSHGPTTYAFPSGHTTAATFICGVALFVLLPAALAALDEQERQDGCSAQPEQQQQQGQAQGQALDWHQTGAANLLNSAARSTAGWMVARRWPLWGGAIALTGIGRVLADAHWVSDVLAGALLGVGLTAATASVCHSIGAGAGPARQQEE